MRLEHINEAFLLKQLHLIFPNEETQINVHKNLAIKYPTSNDYMEFDVWIPSLNLCFEFQDAYHYVTTFLHQREQKNIQQKDYIKHSLSVTRGLSLVVVPCWWTGDTNSLVASIQFVRPDVLSDYKSLANNFTYPIQMNPPIEFFPSSEIPEVGEIMLASFLHKEFNILISPNAWWLGEKYDGIRFCWNADAKQIYSRTGNELDIYPKMESKMPNIFLDGELWFGRGQFRYTYALVKNSESTNWPQLRSLSFDVPKREFQHIPFEDRFAYLLHNTSVYHIFNIVALRVLGQSKEQVKIAADQLINDGAEGIILRKVGSLYEHGRSTQLFKLKFTERDMEGIVAQIDRTGVTLTLPNGTRLQVSAKNVEVPELQVGQVVTFTFDGFARREPTNATIVRIRTDIEWADVVRIYASDKTLAELKRAEQITASKNLCDGTAIKPHKWDHVENRRKFFENYSANNGFDPLIPDHWYRQTRWNILSQPGARYLLLYHDNSIPKALQDLFPNVPFDETKFIMPSRWSEISNRKKFFIDYAKAVGFDPFIPDNWYLQSREKIMAMKGAAQLLMYHNNNLTRALVDLLPGIGLDVHQLRLSKEYFYSKAKRRRQFLEDYAKKLGLNPLNPEHWYTISRKQLYKTKSARGILNYHSGSLGKALLDLFPEIGFEKVRFTTGKAK